MLKGTTVGTVEQLIAARGDDYSDPVSNHRRIASLWTAILGHEVTPHQVALCMVAVKLSREAFRHKDDNCDDGEAYFRIAKIIANES